MSRVVSSLNAFVNDYAPIRDFLEDFYEEANSAMSEPVIEGPPEYS